MSRIRIPAEDLESGEQILPLDAESVEQNSFNVDEDGRKGHAKDWYVHVTNDTNEDLASVEAVGSHELDSDLEGFVVDTETKKLNTGERRVLQGVQRHGYVGVQAEFNAAPTTGELVLVFQSKRQN